MCGICGLAALDGAGPVDRGLLEAMNRALVHRGPDDEGTLLDGPVGLAARRLSIIRNAGKLPAGHLLIWEPGAEPVVRRYARPSPAAAGEVRREPAGELA